MCINIKMTILNYDEFMKIIDGKRLFKLFPKDLKCYDIQYCENKTFISNCFDDSECINGIHFASQDDILYWLSFRHDTYYFCEIIPNKEAKYVVFDSKIKTNICDVGKLFNIHDLIKYLHEEVGLTKKDLQPKHKDSCAWSCINSIDTVKYLHHKIGFTKEDFQPYHNWACLNGNLDIVIYLHKEVELTKEVW